MSKQPTKHRYTREYDEIDATSAYISHHARSRDLCMLCRAVETLRKQVAVLRKSAAAIKPPLCRNTCPTWPGDQA